MHWLPSIAWWFKCWDHFVTLRLLTLMTSFFHSRAEGNLSDVQVHLRHSKQVFQVMRDNKLYANLNKCVFCAMEIPVLGYYASKSGGWAGLEKVSPIVSWPTPNNPTNLRRLLGLANYLHKYAKIMLTICDLCHYFKRKTSRGRGVPRIKRPLMS